MSRKPLIAGNWKMNKTPAESVVLSQGISNLYSRKWNKVAVVLCFIILLAVALTHLPGKEEKA